MRLLATGLLGLLCTCADSTSPVSQSPADSPAEATDDNRSRTEALARIADISAKTAPAAFQYLFDGRDLDDPEVRAGVVESLTLDRITLDSPSNPPLTPIDLNHPDGPVVGSPNAPQPWLSLSAKGELVRISSVHGRQIAALDLRDFGRLVWAIERLQLLEPQPQPQFLIPGGTRALVLHSQDQIRSLDRHSTARTAELDIARDLVLATYAEVVAEATFHSPHAWAERER